MDYNELYERFKEITNTINSEDVKPFVSEETRKKYEALKLAFYSKNPLTRLSIKNRIEELELKLNINYNTKKLTR